MAKMPRQKPGKSEQVVATPPEFLRLVKLRLGIEQFDIDLAADQFNTVCPNYYDEQANSLTQLWKVGDGWNWCNPPYGNIRPWVSKAFTEAVSYGAKTAILVPASVGSNWWNEYVHNIANVTLLNGRITFVGHDSPYPKDLALLLYAPYLLQGGYQIWSWQ